MIRGTFTRIGRITLWLCFWPLGLWRSIVHSQRKRDRRLERELRDEKGRTPAEAAFIRDTYGVDGYPVRFPRDEKP